MKDWIARLLGVGIAAVLFFVVVMPNLPKGSGNFLG